MGGTSLHLIDLDQSTSHTPQNSLVTFPTNLQFWPLQYHLSTNSRSSYAFNGRKIGFKSSAG